MTRRVCQLCFLLQKVNQHNNKLTLIVKGDTIQDTSAKKTNAMAVGRNGGQLNDTVYLDTILLMDSNPTSDKIRSTMYKK